MNTTPRTHRLVDRRAGAVYLRIDGSRALAEYCDHAHRMSRSEAADLLAAYLRLRRSFPTIYAVDRDWQW